MKKNWIVVLALVIALFAAAHSAGAYDDLLLKKKSDLSIKGLVFPKSMKVLENRPQQGRFFFFAGEQKKFDDGTAPSPQVDALNAVLEDPEAVKSTLAKADPVRINPATLGDAVRGPVTRPVLRELAKEFKEDMLLIYRREIRAGDEKWTFHTRGLVYLTKQNRMLALPSDERFLKVSAGAAPEPEAAGAQALAGLQALAKAAKKEILDKKFEVRRSY